MKGTSHDQLGAYTSVSLLIIGIGCNVLPWVWGPVVVGCAIGTMWMGPDLDLPQSLPTKRWGLLKGIWKEYSSSMPHRGLSHCPVIGSLHRVWYLLGRFLGIPFAGLVWIQIVYPESLVHLVLLLTGIEIYCLSHIASDHVYSFLKKVRIIK